MSEAPELYVPAAGQRPIRGHVRAVGNDRVSHGLFLPAIHDEDPVERRNRELYAWLQVLSPAARFTHLTGADLYGWDLPKLPDRVPVFAALGKGDPTPGRVGLVCNRLSHPRPIRIVRGFPVDEPEEVLLRASRDLGVLDISIMLDSARRADDIDEGRLQEVVDSRRPGVAVLRSARDLSDARRESAGETILGVFAAAMQVEVEPQVEIFDDDGTFLARVDYRVKGTARIYEYDGEVHRDKLQHRADLRRERGWGNTSYQRRGFTLDDLLNHGAVVMHEIDRDLGRAHVNRRLRRWQTLVRESLYDDAGRARVLNRWKRAMGVVQWH